MKKMATLLIALSLCFYFNTSLALYVCKCPATNQKQHAFTGAAYSSLGSGLTCAYANDQNYYFLGAPITDPLYAPAKYRGNWKSTGVTQCKSSIPGQCLVVSNSTNCSNITSQPPHAVALENGEK